MRDGTLDDMWSLHRLWRVLLYLVLLAVGVFVAVSGLVAWRFALGPVEAAQVTLRAAVLAAIDGGVAIYDPVSARTAGLGPVEQPAADLHVRAEQFFRERGVHLVDARNATIRTSPFPFRYQPYDDARLQDLRRRYGLDGLVAAAPAEFPAMVRLRSWTRSQFRRRDYQPVDVNFDAVRILDRRLRNDADAPYDPVRHMDPCHFFPMLYCQVMLAAGYQARLVSITHGMAEVWSDQFGKWVLMDAELDLHYEKNGIPLSMMDMHNENFGGDPASIRIVRGTQQSGDKNTTMVYLKKEELSPAEMVRQHRNYIEITEMRNDWWANYYFRGHPARSERSSLVYYDPRMNTRRDVRLLMRPHTSRQSDLYWTLNETEIWVRRSSPVDKPLLVFRTVTPNFSHFEVAVDGVPPKRVVGNTCEWALHPGANTLSVASVNHLGIHGRASSLRLDFAPGGESVRRASMP
jgi:hypothetical protein